ncbi:HelD family protein [Auraticoccus monumenti]|uniref:DNA helicase IV n=1 Tax=Auraticoccus monumenti TaxID=675864 RepID=A0A1G7DQ25_9ACTN|nr:UvrD-helicase domain-containing protein [Auraticoccus monumenti]SDE53601.1 DNA helicase IV [Auraticoccus monumenti]
MTSHESESTVEREIAIEQAHVDQVYARLAEATRTAEQVASQGRRLFQSDRTSFVREEDGTGLYERDVFAFQAARRLATLDAEHEGLVFGRLDRNDAEVRYIGRIGVRDDDYEPLVIDWRARAAEPFYRATPADPMGIVRRRVLRSRGTTVIGIEDDLLDGENADEGLVVVGEGALMAALSRARGPQMRDIVATIQGEQDEAIRAPYQGVTIISGGPGTGKTVVALHRAAYLLYSHRKRFERGGVLVVGPSRVFMNYIERVLPSLGEDSVTLRSVGTVASDVVDLRGERVDPAAAAVVKGSLRMLPVLRRLADEPWVTGPLELRVSIKGEVLTLREAQLTRIRTEVLRHHKINSSRPAAEKALLDALWQQLDGEVDVERAVFDDLVTDQASWTMFLHAWWPPLDARAVLLRLGDPALLARVAGGRLDQAEQRALSGSYAGLDPARPVWSVADGALLDELVAIIGPAPIEVEEDPTLFLTQGTDISELVTTADRYRPALEVDPGADPHERYAHVLVDEAQDITPMQWRMLRRRGSQASWTIVGDTAQSSWPNPAEYARALEDLIGSAPVRRFRMSTNYRSPSEVFALASAVVARDFPDADLPTAVRSTGIEPELLRVTEERLGEEVAALVRRLGEQVEGTIGVVCPPSRLQAVDAALLPGLDGLAPRVALLTALEAKGLEYDAVVVLSPDDIVAEHSGGSRVLYVALTRPTQRLVTVDVGPGSGRWRPDTAR